MGVGLKVNVGYGVGSGSLGGKNGRGDNHDTSHLLYTSYTAFPAGSGRLVG